MTLSRSVFPALLVMGCLSLGLKVLLDAPVNYEKLHPTFMRTILWALEEQGFQPLVQTDRRTWSAFKGTCFVWVGPSHPEGGGDSAFVADYGSLGALRFWYRGKVYPDLPSVTALLDRYIERGKIAVGLEPQIHPVYHLIASPDCTDDALTRLRLEDLQPGDGH